MTTHPPTEYSIQLIHPLPQPLTRLSVRQIAQQTGLPAATVQRFMSNPQKLTLRHLAQLMGAFPQVAPTGPNGLFEVIARSTLPARLVLDEGAPWGRFTNGRPKPAPHTNPASPNYDPWLPLDDPDTDDEPTDADTPTWQQWRWRQLVHPNNWHRSLALSAAVARATAELPAPTATPKQQRKRAEELMTWLLTIPPNASPALQNHKSKMPPLKTKSKP